MTTDLSPAALPDYLQVLSQAAQSYRSRGSFAVPISRSQPERPQPEKVVEALLQAELAAKQQRLQYSFDDLLGEWRLCFTTGVRKRSSSSGRKQGIRLTKGFYLPQWAPAQIGFFAAPEAVTAGSGQGTIANQIQLGAVRLRFTGAAKYLGKKNLLAFDFSQIAIDCFGKTIVQTGFRGGQTKAAQFEQIPFEQIPIAKLPFFAFFSVTPDWVAARGRGGGLALWVRQDAEIG
ncbi:hypothetical protein [Leptolyngbya ohadii]|uniref:hypothetical protein n=1 Tax=Leptolyngbya ohadii TaxID=1962290 RepID=UPI000B59EB36|nr:hypothetical protein [Leptolyngbya ohadii]